MATSQKTMVISDVHMSNVARYSWFQKENADKLIRLLKTLPARPEVTELVLLGDLFDLWLYPVKDIPYTVERIINENLPVAKALRECLTPERAVYYMAGNHDMGVTQHDLDLLADGVGKIHLTTPEKYETLHPGWRLEHGNAADMFNAPDDSDDTIGGYPLGYFITRLVATADDQGTAWQALKELYELLDDMIEAVQPRESALTLRAIGPQRFAIRPIGALAVRMIVESLKTVAEVDDDTIIQFSESEPELNEKRYTVGAIKTRYGSLLGRWYDKYPGVRLLKAMLATHDLGWYAEDLVSENPARKVVVMGHTHAAVEGSPYDNDGCWCIKESLGHGDPYPTYVEIDRDTGTVVQWKLGAAHPKS